MSADSLSAGLSRRNSGNIARLLVGMRRGLRRARWLVFPALALAVAFSPGTGRADRSGGAAMHLAPEGIGGARTWVFGLAMRGNELWAVGSFGIQVKRANGRWDQVVQAVSEIPLAIAFAPSGAGVVVGQEGAVWEVQPKSDKWNKVDLGEKQRLFAVAASSTGEFVAAGAFGVLWERPAGQSQWQRVETQWKGFDGPHLYAAMFTDDRQAVMVGERGTVITLVQGQITNTSEHGEESLFAVTRCGTALVAAGQEGFVLATE